GRNQTGGIVALPIWLGYMEKVLKDIPEMPRSTPPGVVTVPVMTMPGENPGPAPGGAPKLVPEYFYQEAVPPPEVLQPPAPSTPPAFRSKSASTPLASRACSILLSAAPASASNSVSFMSANIRILCVSFFSAWRSRCSSAAGRRGRCICATIRRRASSRQSPRRPSRYPIRAATTLNKTSHDLAFAYRNGTLCAEQVSLEDIARRFGTPCYVYSRAAIEGAYGEFAQALHGRDAMLCYSVKANSNLAVLALLARLGAGFDIVSGGELARVLAAGGDPRKILFSGVGKTRDEIRLALEKNIYCVNLESAAELERVAAVAPELGRRAPVAFRVNPDVDASTHPYISTGLRENKFGVAHRDAERLYAKAAAMPALEVIGIGCHIGSQLVDPAPLAAAVERLAALAGRIEAAGIRLRHLDLGGGIGIRYRDETPRPLREFVAGALAALGDRRGPVIFDPGRAGVGHAGGLVSRGEI